MLPNLLSNFRNYFMLNSMKAVGPMAWQEFSIGQWAMTSNFSDMVSDRIPAYELPPCRYMLQNSAGDEDQKV